MFYKTEERWGDKKARPLIKTWRKQISKQQWSILLIIEDHAIKSELLEFNKKELFPGTNFKIENT